MIHTSSAENSCIEITVIGPWTGSMGMVVDAIARACESGFGQHRRPVIIDVLEEVGPRSTRVLSTAELGVVAEPDAPFCADQLWRGEVPDDRFPLVIDLVSPTRIVVDGKVQAEPTFSALVRRGLDRAMSFVDVHDQRALEIDLKGLKQAAASVRTVLSALRWVRNQRFSSRQGRVVRIEGAVGRMVLEGPWSTFWPLLRLLERIHVGKASVVGQGRISLSMLGSAK